MKTEHPNDAATGPEAGTTDAARPDGGAAADSAALQDAERRAAEAEERALRAQAELQNVKRRHREETERIQDTATKHLVVDLLPVIDDLERALEAARTTQNFEALRSGVELTLGKLTAALRAVGVERMEGVGAPFDPNFHEAVLRTEPTEEHPSGTITQEMRSGYTQHGRVIRPSMVAVANE